MKFQLERIILFSDAVFAIAITLMMIEVKPPHLHHEMSFTEALIIFLKKLPIFTGTILSFLLIGFFWTRHHKLMQFVKAYDSKLLWLNLLFLLSIAFIPFSTGFVFENTLAHSPLPMLIYNLNYIAATILSFILFNHALNPKNGLAVDELGENLRNVKKELLFPIAVYVTVIILAFLDTNYAPVGYALFALQSLFKDKKKEAMAEEPVLATSEGEKTY